MSPGKRHNCRNWAVESGCVKLSSDPGRASCRRRVIKVGGGGAVHKERILTLRGSDRVAVHSIQDLITISAD